MYLALNAYWEPLDFDLPPAGGAGASAWRRWIDTALVPPQDIVAWDAAPLVAGPRYRVEARSVVVLFAEASLTRAELAMEEAID